MGKDKGLLGRQVIYGELVDDRGGGDGDGGMEGTGKRAFVFEGQIIRFRREF